MKTATKLILAAAALSLSGCYTMMPRELADAKAAYDRAYRSAARTQAPSDLYDARRLLENSERAMNAGEDIAVVRDYAYLALRKVELAESHARTQADWEEIITARRALDTLQAKETKAAQQKAAEAQAALNAAKERLDREVAERDAALAASKETSQKAQEQADAARQQMEATQAALNDLNDKLSALQKVAPVKQEERGMVITLSGSVLFASGRATLFPAAMLRLDQVATALKTMPETTHITVEGHTDDVGTAEFNQQLSLSRAQVVRDYLVGKGLAPTRIEAYGFGSTRPLVDNTNPENRANNRRVEIVIHGAPPVSLNGATPPIPTN
jgi:outer membrane protein OmpA-like peptidoglycan-associated protein